jgi:hypothetical protein
VTLFERIWQDGGVVDAVEVKEAPFAGHPGR